MHKIHIMSGILFDELIFGPVHSRRLGISLGINLLPTDNKFCNFNCVYCECGWNEKGRLIVLPKRADVKQLLIKRLHELLNTTNEPDAITFAGNGEPTTHPEFAEIIHDTIEVRDLLIPKAKISVLSNASMLHVKTVREALMLVDKNIQKLDAGTETMFQRINQPQGSITLARIVENLMFIKNNLIIQTLFVRGSYVGQVIDNTQGEELDAWLELVRKIQPKRVMLYPIDRETPAEDLEKIPRNELEVIAQRVQKLGVDTEVYD